jgi:RNA ligase (TIGR02306 family)
VSEPAKSTHRVDVVRVNLEPIPGADKVALARVYGYTCVTAKDQWSADSLGAYIPPDSLVDPARPVFSFLAKDTRSDGLVRIKARKLRGVLSFGLLVPAPPGVAEGDDVAELLGVTHYEPPVKGAGGGSGLVFGGETCAGPSGVYAPKYDVEAFRRYAQEVFTPGEPVVVSEKIHGASSKYVFQDGVMYCGSRTEWKKEYPSYNHLTVDGIADQLLAVNKTRAHKMGYVELSVEDARARAGTILDDLRNKPAHRNLWWKALDATPTLRAFCEANPGVVVYGEVYGAVQDLTYGRKPGEVSFAAFDLLENGEWVDAIPSWIRLKDANVPQVPIATGKAGWAPFDFDRLCDLAEGPSLIHPGHCREGVVVKPLVERRHDKIGRVQLKIVGAGYLERSKG